MDLKGTVLLALSAVALAAVGGACSGDSAPSRVETNVVSIEEFRAVVRTFVDAAVAGHPSARARYHASCADHVASDLGAIQAAGGVRFEPVTVGPIGADPTSIGSVVRYADDVIPDQTWLLEDGAWSIRCDM